MKKKISVLLIAIMCLSLAACGGGADTSAGLDVEGFDYISYDASSDYGESIGEILGMSCKEYFEDEVFRTSATMIILIKTTSTLDEISVDDFDFDNMYCGINVADNEIDIAIDLLNGSIAYIRYNESDSSAKYVEVTDGSAMKFMQDLTKEGHIDEYEHISRSMANEVLNMMNS